MLDYIVEKASYVYTLAYPDGTVFYVGQGVKNRIASHESEARRGVQSVKCDIIRQIWRDGGQVVRAKVRTDLGYHEALEIERKLIRQLLPIGNSIGHNKPKISIPLASVKGDLAKRFRRQASVKAGRKLSDAEIAELATRLAYQALDAYCEASDRNEEATIV